MKFMKPPVVVKKIESKGKINLPNISKPGSKPSTVKKEKPEKNDKEEDKMEMVGNQIVHLNIICKKCYY